VYHDTTWQLLNIEKKMNSRGGYHLEDVQPGMSASIAKTVTDADIILFAGISTDVNPVHRNEEWARTTQFGWRVAHGMFSAGFILSVLANKLSGPGTVYLGQTLKSRAQVRMGDTATVTVRERSRSAGVASGTRYYAPSMTKRSAKASRHGTAPPAPP